MSAAHNSVRRRLLLGGAAVAGLAADEPHYQYHS